MKWIDMKDSYPPANSIVLVCGSSNTPSEIPVVAIAIFHTRTFEFLPIRNKGFTSEVPHEFESQNVTHWMYLPNPIDPRREESNSLQPLKKETKMKEMNTEKLYRHIMQIDEDILHQLDNMDKSINDFKLSLQKQREGVEIRGALFKEIVAKRKRFLSTYVDEAEFSIRTTNGLINAKCETLKDVLEKGQLFMLKIRNFGKKSLNEVRAKFDENGIEF